MKIFGFLLIVCLSHNVLMEDTTETIEPEENTTKAYDVIINDRESNDVIINVSQFRFILVVEGKSTTSELKKQGR